jgi:hypothetical protein
VTTDTDALVQRPSKEEIEKRVAWWITDFHFKAPEQLTEGYWKMMAREIAEYAAGESS